MLSTTASSQVYSYTKVLNFQGQKQQKENWCWAAVTAAIHNFYDPQHTMTQAEVVELCLGSVKDKKFSARLALAGVGHLNLNILNRMANWDEIQAEIWNGRPIVVSSGEHVLVIYGFEVFDDGDYQLYFYDSEEDRPRTLSAKSFMQEYSVQHSYMTC